MSDKLNRYELSTKKNGNKKVIRLPHQQEVAESWYKRAEKLENDYSKKCGVIIGTVEVLVHVLLLKGVYPLIHYTG